MQITGPEGTVTADTFTCAHCQRQVVCTPGEDVGKVCMPCYAMICVECVKKGICEPFEKKLLEMEAKAKLKQAAG